MVWRNAGLTLAAFIIQGTLAENLAIQGIRPDFILIVLIYLALAYGSLTGVILGFVVGLLQDFYGPATSLGLNALCKSLTGFCVGLGKEGLYKENLVILTLVLLVAHTFHDALYWLVNVRFQTDLFLQGMWRSGLPTIAYTTVIGVLLALLIAYRGGQFNARRLFPK
jgi:rod shape-determining protein MreD